LSLLQGEWSEGMLIACSVGTPGGRRQPRYTADC